MQRQFFFIVYNIIMAIIYKHLAMFLQKFAYYCTQVFLIHTSTQLFVLFLRSGGIDIGITIIIYCVVATDCN